MNSLTEGIESAIKNAIEEYVQRICLKYEEIESSELEELWNEVAGTIQISVSVSNSSKPITSNISSDTEENSGCPYKYIKGIKKDQCCGAKPKAGNTYCSRHKKYEGTTPKERNVSPVSKKNSIKAPKTNNTSVKSVQRVLRKNKNIEKLWHEETGLVFRSAKERIVIGKCVNNKIISLTEEDFDECRKWGFSFLPKEDKSEDEKTSETDEVKHIYMIDNSRQKFWGCTVNGVEYTTKYGKVGKKGKTLTKTFDTHKDALNEMDSVLKSKQKKGYVVEEIKNQERTTDLKEESPIEKKSPSCTDNESNDESIADIINEMQESSDNESTEVEKSLGKNFIATALGIKVNKQTENVVKSIDDEEELEFEEEFEEE